MQKGTIVEVANADGFAASTGKIVGDASWLNSDGNIVGGYVVELEEGSWLADRVGMFVSIIVAHPDNLTEVTV